MLNCTLDKDTLFLACDLDLTGFGLGPVMGFAIGGLPLFDSVGKALAA
jgi:hypothetical protein